MGNLSLAGATSGQITLSPPSVAGTNTLSLPAATDTLVGRATTDTLTNKTLTSPALTSPTISGTPVMGASVITSGTAQASTSGTAILFSSIPSWVKRITVMFNGVSTSGTNNPQIQIGSGSVLTSGYLGYGQSLSTTPSSGIVAAGTGWIMISSQASNIIYGVFTIVNINSNNWVISGALNVNSTASSFLNGSVSLSGTLDRVNITTVGGTDTFDAGSINIMYE